MPPSLPTPDDAACAHSERLVALLHEEIAARGPMPATTPGSAWRSTHRRRNFSLPATCNKPSTTHTPRLPTINSAGQQGESFQAMLLTCGLVGFVVSDALRGIDRSSRL